MSATLTSALLQQYSADGTRDRPCEWLRYRSLQRDDNGEVLCGHEVQHLGLDVYDVRPDCESVAARNRDLFVLAVAIVGGGEEREGW